MSGFTVPQLVLLEAGRGITRRGFLKFLGKGAAVVANPDKVTKLAAAASHFGPKFRITAPFELDGYSHGYNAGKMIGEVLGVFKTLKGIGVKSFGLTKHNHDSYERFLQGTIPNELLPELLKDAKKVVTEFGNYYVTKINGIECFIEPDNNSGESVGSDLLRIIDTASLLKNLVADMNLTTIGFNSAWKASKKLKDYLNEKGLKLRPPGENISWDDLSDNEKKYLESMDDEAIVNLPDNLRSPEMEERVKEYEERIRREDEERVEQVEKEWEESMRQYKEREAARRRASYEKWVPRAGYEKKDQFDPKSSVYSPPVNLEFEERLRVRLRLV